MSKTAYLLYIAVALVLFAKGRAVPAEKTATKTRQLQQRGGKEIIITSQNVHQFNELVANARRNAVFVVTEDIQLPSAIEVNTPRLTFRGDPNVRPSVTCAKDEEGFMIHANGIEIENLILRNCTKTAVHVLDKTTVCDDPFDPECQSRPPQRLDVTLTNVDFIDNFEADELSAGGGFHAEAEVHAQILGCRFQRNTGIGGGAISFHGHSLRVENSSFIANVASNTGGAILVNQQPREAEAELQTSQITIVDSTFEGNSVLRGGRDQAGLTLTGGSPLEANPYLRFPLPSPSGGAIYVADYAEVDIEKCTFKSNHAVPAGGAIHFSDNQKITVRNSNFEGNYVEPPQNTMDESDLQMGGAIFAAFSEITSKLDIEKSTFDNNSAVYGGAFHYVAPIESSCGINDCQFNNNRASLGGGAVVFRNVAAPEAKTTVFKNNTAFVGGAIFLTNGAGLTLSEGHSDLTASRFEDNVAFDGGAMFGIGSGIIHINRVFYVQNKAEQNGGAVCFINSKTGSDLSVTDVQMHNNSAQKGGAMYVESVSTVRITVGSADPNAEAFGIVDLPRNEFFGNSAICGGAIYYKASNSILNKFKLDSGKFSGNTAHSNLSAVSPDSLEYPNAAVQSTQRFFEAALKDEDSVPSDADLLDPTSANPCYPGGGGAICMDLNGIANRAPATIEIYSSNFTSNVATVGGAMMISTEEDIDWKPDCPSSTDQTSTLLTSDPCRTLNLHALTFRRNRAQAAGGALMVSNLRHVYYSEVAEVDRDFNYQTLDKMKKRDRFIDNQVGKDGYGKDIAGTAVRLGIRHPIADPATGILITNQSSGRTHFLPPIEIQVLDGLDQVVTGGIVDASLAVSVDPLRLDSDGLIAAGQVLSTPSNGVAVFDALSLSALPGRYEIIFSARVGKIKAVSASVTLRECHLGERYNSEGFACESCALESFTFYVDVDDCADCPDNARCEGNASLVPALGYWHSSPFSVIMHECFHNDACSYGDRQKVLEKMRNAKIQEFLDRFDQEKHPVFSNEEYEQCSAGYEGPLCGSCAGDYGLANGKTCVECSTKTTTAIVISLLGLWQLIFLAITIRSALVSGRDMKQTMDIAQQHATRAVALSRLKKNNRSRRPATFMMRLPNNQSSAADAATRSRSLPGDVTQTEIEVQPVRFSNTSQPTPASVSSPPIEREMSSSQQHSADYVIAAQHVSETIKIFVNFSQVTAIAVNINLEWTNSIKNMLAGMHSVAGFSNGAGFTPMTCLLDMDSDFRSIYGVLLRVSFPFFLMLLAMFFFVAQWLVMRYNPSMAPLVCRHFLRSRLIISFLVVEFFAYQSISEDLMGTISCIRLDSDAMSRVEEFDDPQRNASYAHFSIADGYYWTQDTNIECFRQNHAILVVFLGIPGIVFFLCGVPLYLLILLFRKRRMKKLMEPYMLNTYSFIYQNYKDKFVYWEVIILFRKALIVAVIVFAYPLGSNLQAVMALGILTLALVLHLIAAPFKYPRLNVLEGCSLMVSIFSFYGGVVFNDANTSEYARVLLTVILVIVNSLLMAVILFAVFFYGDKCVEAQLKLMEATDIPRNPIRRMIRLAFVLQERVKHVAMATVHQKLQPFVAGGAPSNQ